MGKVKKAASKISIVIPCYNVEKYIVSTINSILRHKGGSNIEIIAVDDCSTDGTWGKLQGIRVPELVIARNGINRGVSYTRNRGIKMSTGSVLMFLDGDDEYVDNLFEVILQVFNKYEEIDLVSFGFRIEYEGKVKNLSAMFKQNIFCRSQFLLLFFRRKIKQCMCSFAVRRDVIEKHEIFFDEYTQAGEDQEFQIKCMLGSQYIYYTNDVFFVYKMRKSSFMKSSFSEKRISSIRALTRVRNLIESERMPKRILTSFSTYVSLEYLSLLKGAAKSQDEEMIDKVLAHRNVLDYKTDFSTYRSAFIVRVLSCWHKFSTKSLISFLRKS